MAYPSSMVDQHACRVVVVTCIDYRFFPWLDVMLRDLDLHGHTDVISWPGGGASLAHGSGDVVLEALALSFELHNPTELILVAHQDCGRFDGSGAFESKVAEFEALETMLTTAADRAQARASPPSRHG